MCVYIYIYILPFKGSKLLYKLLRPTINLVFWLLSHNISNIGIKFDAWRERERELHWFTTIIYKNISYISPIKNHQPSYIYI